MESNKLTISVIVPVYNTELYLHRCIDSILSQTFTDFELLLINDGSTDRSGEICDEYAAKDSRIKVFHKENGGVSSARNMGLDEARGEWVAFVDADDYWYADNVLEQLLDIVKQNDLDIVRGEYKAVDWEGNSLFYRPVSKRRMKYINRILNSYEFLEYAIQGEFFLWLCLFKRKYIKDLRFEVGRVFLEDMQFLSKLMIGDSRCMYVPDVRFYAYRKIETSASNNASLERLRNSFDMCNCLDRYAQQAKGIELRRYFQCRSVMMYYWTLETIAQDPYFTSRRQIITLLQLDALWRTTFRRMWKYGIWNKSFPFIMVPSIYGVRGMRIRKKMKASVYSIKEELYRRNKFTR